MEEGDNNTKFFHYFVNYCKSLNTIWEIRNREGVMVKSFVDKAEASCHHFSRIF
jgi:hypothetical protein